ncbi:hypothetical protein CDL12_08302 [Handroanthus impetiginosus]|uniref:Uncharacterized protein n=1 Tax=Handroanthus impetiginosus TaxID=429701 RepID=A0A2G9HNB2_9LAMI|nr:hypothetical protein CDL12_08302 [Handroanthus impetiginosus]
MGYEFNHHPKIQEQKTNIFLPMFCRLSIKDINLNNHYKNPTSRDEPSSPTVSCIGQVKRNNRVSGFPATAGAAANHHRHNGLRKPFPSKTFLPTTAGAGANHYKHTNPRKVVLPGKTLLQNITGAGDCPAVRGGGGRSGINRRYKASKQVFEIDNSRRLRTKNDQDCGKVVDIGEMDPPLPVVKRVAPPGTGRDEVNIWKRRLNGGGLKSLQIEQIHPPSRRFEVCMVND